MNITIVGCGKFGTALAEALSQEDHDITVIDIDRGKLQKVSDNFDVMGFVGNGTSFQMLEEAGVDRTDVLIAVTGKDEVNLLCCVVAKKAGRNRAGAGQDAAKMPAEQPRRMPQAGAGRTQVPDPAMRRRQKPSGEQQERAWKVPEVAGVPGQSP